MAGPGFRPWRRRGATEEVSTPRGTKAQTRWALVDLEGQIREIAGNPDPGRLAGSYLSSVGAPIYTNMDSRRVVVSGNGRANAIGLAYEQGKAGEYRAGLAEHVKRAGVDPGQLDGMERPALVRELAGKVDLDKFARKWNEPSVSARSATEVAQGDAGRLSGDVEIPTKLEALETAIRRVEERHAADRPAKDQGARSAEAPGNAPPEGQAGGSEAPAGELPTAAGQQAAVGVPPSRRRILGRGAREAIAC